MQYFKEFLGAPFLILSRIMGGFLDYVAVVTKYPEYKDGIDTILIANK